MKTLIISFILGLLGGILFTIGYTLGEAKEVVVYKDALTAKVLREQQIGTVAGTESARLVEEKNSEDLSDKKTEEASLLDEINSYRTNHNLGKLVRNEELCIWVEERINQLVQKGSLDQHDGFRSQSQHYLKEKGFTKLAENIAQGQVSVTEVVASWDQSLAHKNTMQTQEMDVACAVFENSFGVLVTGRR